MLTDEGRALRLYLIRMVDEMRAAQSIVPAEISQTISEMKAIGGIKRAQAHGIMNIQLGETGGTNSVLEVLNNRLTVPADNVEDATAWILRADSIRLDGWANALAKMASKVAVWKVDGMENVERVTRHLESMKNRAVMQKLHRHQKPSSSETFIKLLKNDIAGNPFNAKSENMFNVALFAGTSPKLDEKKVQVKNIMLSTVRNDRLNIDMPALTLPELKAVGSKHGWIKNDPTSYTPILNDEGRKLTEDEKRQLSAKDQAVFLYLHERARRDFDAAASTA